MDFLLLSLLGMHKVFSTSCSCSCMYINIIVIGKTKNLTLKYNFWL